ncbi:hypothetical protein [Clostridium sp.]|uniref:hypothetical protein n=1 Tax=Clostridium sp. TaxID=1506 RepID=UPI002FC7D42F
MKELLQVKKLIALGLTLGFLYLTFSKVVSSTEFIAIYSLIIGYYFGQSTVRQVNKEVR